MLHNKFWQAFFALAPIIILFVALIGYFIFLFSLLSHLPQVENEQNVSGMFIMGNIGVFLLLVFMIIFLSVASLIFYIFHAVQNPNLQENNLLIVWILLFVFVGGIGQLIYWIVEIIGKRRNDDVVKPA